MYIVRARALTGVMGRIQKNIFIFILSETIIKSQRYFFAVQILKY